MLNLGDIQTGELLQYNWADAEGNPAGGFACKAPGLAVYFQNGPIQENGINGCQVTDLLQAAHNRLTYLNSAGEGRYRCPENDAALEHIYAAQQALQQRTARREQAGIEGRNIPDHHQ